MKHKLINDQWVCCPFGSGYRRDYVVESTTQFQRSIPSSRKRHFKTYSVGQIKEIRDDYLTVWIVGANELWDVPISEIEPIDVLQTGDKFDKKICNICHCLLDVEKFDRNQNNKNNWHCSQTKLPELSNRYR